MNKPAKRAGKHGSNNPNWKGGRLLRPIGYIVVYAPNHPHPSENGTHVLEHRLVMEKHLGRYLDPSEFVHHKNHNKQDNRIENLEILTQAEHARQHRLACVRAHPKNTCRYGHPFDRVSKKRRYCSICNRASQKRYEQRLKEKRTNATNSK